jgi:hypothetical protein
LQDVFWLSHTRNRIFDFAMLARRWLCCGVAILAAPALARPDLTVAKEVRSEIQLSSFGYVEGGTLNVTLSNFLVRNIPTVTARRPFPRNRTPEMR